MRSGFLSGPHTTGLSGYQDKRGDKEERAGASWLVGPLRVLSCGAEGTGGLLKKRPFCDILSQLKLILMHSSALEPPCGARSYELDQKIPAVRWPSKKPLE